MLSFISLFWSVAWAKKGEDGPEVMTNFLTEDDLNKAFIKLIGVIAVPVLVQLFLAWRDSKKDLTKDVMVLKHDNIEMKTMIKLLLDRPSMSKADVHNIARDVAENVVDRHVGGKR